jgi:tRNA-splicing ligase RtcB
METPKTAKPYEVFAGSAGVPIKSWTVGVPFEPQARAQLERIARLPFIHKWVAAMPDVHQGKGATIGSVIPTLRAVVPAAVGVDIGCGMMATRTSLVASHLPDDLRAIRSAIEEAIPHGRTDNGGPNDKYGVPHHEVDTSSCWKPLAIRVWDRAS